MLCNGEVHCILWAWYTGDEIPFVKWAGIGEQFHVAE